jgi:predicted nucleic acid-binding protein
VTNFLLDTNVLSEFSRSTIPPSPKVRGWVESLPPEALYTSVLTFGEIRKGIELLRPSKKRTELERWLDEGLNVWFGKTLLPVTKAISNRWGILAAESQPARKAVGQYRRPCCRNRL